MPRNKIKIALLASGEGGNLQAVIDRIARGKLDAEIVCVLSDNPNARALKRAKAAGLRAQCIAREARPASKYALAESNAAYTAREARAAFERALTKSLNQSRPDLIVLAGFMRILSAQFVSRYRDKIINLHPSLLPQFRGLNTHQRAIDAGAAKHGASVHFVTAELDAGAVIDQREVNVYPDDTAETLRRRVSLVEHQLLPDVIQSFAEGQIAWSA